jgi:alpha-tubulin suppressor-like RCC1 family protein
MAIKTDGTLWAWGYQASGELGQNNNTNYSSPRQIPGTTWESIDNMYNVTLATKTDGTLWSWGYNNNGELGQNSQVKYSSPVQVPGAWKTGSTDTGRTIAAGSDNSLALKVQ